MNEPKVTSNSVPTSPLVLRKASSSGKAYSVSPSAMELGGERETQRMMEHNRASRMSGSSPLGSYSEEETVVRWGLGLLVVLHDSNVTA